MDNQGLGSNPNRLIMYTGVTQLVRVVGLYPTGRGFKSYLPYHFLLI